MLPTLFKSPAHLRHDHGSSFIMSVGDDWDIRQMNHQIAGIAHTAIEALLSGAVSEQDGSDGPVSMPVPHAYLNIK